ncbi:MAG: hypothetical protein ACOC0M_08420 [Halomonas sp.]
MHVRPLLACLAVTWLTGCALFPEAPFGQAPASSRTGAAAAGCHAEVPGFANADCLLHDWVAFGLASQRGDRAWRDAMLSRLDGPAAEQRLGRAVALGWGSESQWDRASELYKADLHAAPAALQPLLRYWLNELEGRRAMASRLVTSNQALADMEAQHTVMQEENTALAEKLEALTAIEQSINLRQQHE